MQALWLARKHGILVRIVGYCRRALSTDPACRRQLELFRIGKRQVLCQLDVCGIDRPGHGKSDS